MVSCDGWPECLARSSLLSTYAEEEVALANLDSAFGDSRSRQEKRRIAVGSYQTFARTMLELFWSPNLSEPVAREIARFEGLELDSCHTDPRQSAVYLCLHYLKFRVVEPIARLHNREYSGDRAAIQEPPHRSDFRSAPSQHQPLGDSARACHDSNAQTSEERGKFAIAL